MAKWKIWRDNDGTADDDHITDSTVPSTDLFTVAPGEGPLQVTARVVDSGGDRVARGSCTFQGQILEVITTAGKDHVTETTPVRQMRPGETWVVDDSGAGSRSRTYYFRVVNAVASQPVSFHALRIEALAAPRR
jgi:hypothetical protein